MLKRDEKKTEIDGMSQIIRQQFSNYTAYYFIRTVYGFFYFSEDPLCR